MHDGPENFLTYRTAWALCGLALRGGANALLDGTNLTESGRRGAYAAADAAGAPVAVVLVLTARAVLEGRAAAVGEERLRAYAKLGHREPRPEASRPFLALDGALAPEENLARLRSWEPLRPLFHP